MAPLASTPPPASRETLSALGVAALAYAAKGWPVFAVQSDKTPFPGSNGVLDATTDPAKIAAMWARRPDACIGLDVAGAGMMVVDADTYKPAFDAKAFADLNFPETKLRAKSPRGGSHLFYALAEGEIVSNDATGKLAPCVDVRSFHGYILLWPSRTADGEYAWIEEGAPAYRTDDMVRLANSHREKSKDRDRWSIPADRPENVERAAAWLKADAKPAIKGQGGNSMAYKTGAYMKSLGISEAMAFDLMWEHWRPRCTPAWYSEETLQTVIEHAYAYNTSPPGHMTAAYKAAKSASLFRAAAQVRDPDAPGIEHISGPFRFADSEAIDAIKPPRFLVDDFIPTEAYAMLFGAPGTFKSFIALDIALSIAAGMAVNPTWAIEKSANVLYAAGEGRSHFAERKRAWERVHFMGQRVPGIVLADPVPSVAEDWRPFYDGALKLSPDGYFLTVIDTLGVSMGGENESDFASASLFTKKVRETILVLGGSVLAIHHVGHDTRGRPIGSSAFIRDPDTMVRVDRKDKAMAVSLHMTKQRDGTEWTRPKGIALTVNGSSLVAIKADAPKADATKRKDEAKAIFEQSAVDKIIDAAIKDELESNKSGAFSQRQLAEILAARPEIEIGSVQLRTVTLTRLRETNGTYANKAFRPKAKPAVSWRWHEFPKEN